MKTTAINVVRAADRYHTELDWLDSWHSFSFGEHYHPNNRGHGQLIVHNDDIIAPGTGFGFHPHSHMEILTWVLSGELEHRDSAGNHGVIRPGLAQRMSAGTGILHSEMNPSPDKPVRLLQMWVRPDRLDVAPGYEQKDVSSDLARGGLVPIASGFHKEAAIRIHQKNATFWVGRLTPGEQVALPESPQAHLFVAEGEATLESAGKLTEGDAARLSQAGTPSLTAGPKGAHVALWTTA